MKIFENYNKAKQKFGENLAQPAIEAKIPNQFVYAACKFNVENGTPFNDLYNLFSQWTTYVAPRIMGTLMIQFPAHTGTVPL